MVTETNREKLPLPINVRLLREEEIPGIARVYIDAFKSSNLDEKWTQASAEGLMRYWFTSQPDLFFLATQGEKIAGGIVGGIKPWWDGPHLTDAELFIDPKFQNQKIGKQLVKTLLKTAVEKYQIVEFESVADGKSEFPLEWYERIGIKRTNLAHIAGNPTEILKNLKQV